MLPAIASAMTRSQPSKASRRGFTLVELLVVIAIIGVLVAILMPALKKARQAAVSVQCLSQIRQIGLGIQLYAQDCGGWIPSPGDNAYWRSTQSGPNRSWQDRLAMTGAIKVTNVNWAAGHNPALLAGYWIHNVFICPGYSMGKYETSQSIKGAFFGEYAGYGMNRFISPERDNGGPNGEDLAGFIKLAKLKKDKVVIADGFLRINVGTDNVSSGQLFRRHSDGANYLFGDMHGEYSNQYHNTGFWTGGIGKHNNVWSHADYDNPINFSFVAELPQPAH